MPRALTKTLLALFVSASLAAPAAAASVRKAQNSLQQLSGELKGLEDRLLLVERQYVQRREAPEQEALRQQYAKAETLFLLNDYQPASVLLYDLVGSPAFRPLPEYASALFLLGESLYQQKNYRSARPYFRGHLDARGGRYQQALSRYLEISGRFNEFAGIETYVDQARGEGGKLPDDIAYVYAKWLFRRTDVPAAERIAAAEKAFAALAAPGSPYTMQAAYFLGVLAVQQNDLPKAAERFERVLKLQPRGDDDRKVLEQANLSLGRVYFENGQYDAAIARFQALAQTSPLYPEALDGIAWSHVRLARERGPMEYEKALQACEKLKAAAANSVLAPEARVLEGHLLLRLGRHQDAAKAYTAIINEYQSVYVNIDGRLQAHPDPVSYFQKAIGTSGKSFDVGAYLPEKAVKWATTQRDVAAAMRVSDDIDASQKGVDEATEIVTRLSDVLDKRAMDVFPQFQEGLARSEAVDAALARIEADLLRIEEDLVGPSARAPGLVDELAKVRQARAALEERFKALPKTEVEIEARRERLADRIRQLELRAFEARTAAQELTTLVAALEKYVVDTRAARDEDPREEQDLANQLVRDRAVVEQLHLEHEQAVKDLRDARARLSLLGVADRGVRTDYEALLARERQLMQSARGNLDADVKATLGQLDQIVASATQLKARSAEAKKQIQSHVRVKSDAFRQKVLEEEALLKSYRAEAQEASGQARNLVGSIAYESFKRVRTQFYDMVLKADVGLVDIAWTRKQQKTNQIHDLAKQKDREMKDLQDEFREVLTEVP